MTFSVFLRPVPVNEGSANSQTEVEVIVTRDRNRDPSTVYYSTRDGTATTADRDYQSATGTLDFGIYGNVVSFNVLVNGDEKYEDDESFFVDLSRRGSYTSLVFGPDPGSNPTETVTASYVVIPYTEILQEATVTIKNDDPQPTLTLTPGDVSHLEGNSGETDFVYTVVRTGDAQPTETVIYAVSGTGANPADGSDFVNGSFPSGTVTFAQGQSIANITIAVMGDTSYEQTETFLVSLTGESFAMSTMSVTQMTSTATGTIQNDDASSGGGGGGGGGNSGGGSSISTTPTPGSDSLTVPAGGTVAAGPGNDTVIGAGSNLLLGNQGDDSITAGPGPNTLLGGMGNDTVTAQDGNDLIFGGEGTDTITAGNGNNTIVGGSGNSATDSLDGADFITAGSGNDLILGNGGDDTVASGAGNDTALGGFGNDLILGNQGNDLVLGNQGNDTLVGGFGADTLVGGMGNDVLYGSEGDDVLYGNEGSNRFVFNPGDTDFKSGVSTGDTVMDFKSGTDKIDFVSGPAGTASNFGSGAVVGGSFAALQAAAQQLLNSGNTYAFETDGTDGYLFTTAGNGGGASIEDVVRLAGVKQLGPGDIV